MSSISEADAPPGYTRTFLEALPKQAERVKRHQYRCSGVCKNGGPTAGDSGDSRNEKDYLKTECNRDVLPDVGHRPLRQVGAYS